MVSVSGRKWAGTELTGFKATANARTGALKGSFTFLTGDAQRPKKVRGTFAGAVMGGAGYGSVVVKGEGSWAVKVTPCGGCSDD